MSTKRYSWVKTSELKIERYNRSIDIAYAKSIAADYKDAIFGTIVVSQRDGTYYIIDGQHRVYAANAIGLPHVHCEVHEGLAYEDEATLFVALNRNRKGLCTYDYIKGLYEAGDPVVIGMYNTAEAAGFQVSKQVGTGKIAATRSLMNLYKKCGQETTGEILTVLRLAWAGDKDSLKGDMLDGMRSLFTEYGSEIDSDRLAAKLNAYMPTRILAEADADPSGGMKRTRIARALLKHYNNRLQNKLVDRL